MTKIFGGRKTMLTTLPQGAQNRRQKINRITISIYSQFAPLSFRPSNQLAPMSTRPTNQLAPLVDQLAPGKYGANWYRVRVNSPH